MKTSIRTILALMCFTLAGHAAAQSAAIGSASGNPGDIVTVDVNFTSGATGTQGITMLLNFDDNLYTLVAPDPSNNCGWESGLGIDIGDCIWAGAGDGRFNISVGGDTDLLSGRIARVLFTINGTATLGTVDPITASPFEFLDASGGPITSATVSPGQITVILGPQPDFSSNPTPATGVSLSVIQGGADPNGSVLITNAGEADSTLTGDCSITSDVTGGIFSLAGDTTFSVGDQAAPDALIDVFCDSAGAIDDLNPHTGVMTCNHDGDGTTEASPAVYALSCLITSGPQSAYSDVLAPNPMALAVAEEGDANATGTLTVTNSGDSGTTLTGSCTYAGDTQISIADGAFTLGQGVSQVATVSCDGTAEGSYTGTVSCTHDAGNVASPVVHDPVTCVVGPPGDAAYASVPVPGSVIDMTTEDVPVGAVVPDQVLTITNDAAEANDRDLVLGLCAFTGDAAITASAPTSPVAAQASTSVTFSCDTAAVGAYTGTYSCEYFETGNEVADGTATYTVNCGVRAAAADILESPVSGTALTILVPIGGTGFASVNFNEILDEGVDATVDSCSFGTAIFSVVSTLPVTVAAGGTVKIDVSGSDNGSGALTFTDTLTCSYTDTDSTPGEASWPVTLTVLAQPIPTLSTWGLLLMILTLMGLGGIVIRRKV